MQHKPTAGGSMTTWALYRTQLADGMTTVGDVRAELQGDSGLCQTHMTALKYMIDNAQVLRIQHVLIHALAGNKCHMLWTLETL